MIVALAEEAGHKVLERHIVADEPAEMNPLLQAICARDDLDAILVTGGTGVSPRDQTYETVSALLTKPLPGYGELFRMLSYAEIGPACLLSRAVGGLIDKMVILVMPGSRTAVELAMRKIILPGAATHCSGGEQMTGAETWIRPGGSDPIPALFHARFLNKSRNRSSYSLKAPSRSSSRFSS